MTKEKAKLNEKKYTVQELAVRWECSERTVYAYVTRGKRKVKLNPCTPTKHIFKESAVLEFEHKTHVS